MTPETAALAYLGLTLAQLLIEKGPEAYFKIVNAMQKADPTLEDVDAMIAIAKNPDAYLNP